MILSDIAKSLNYAVNIALSEIVPDLQSKFKFRSESKLVVLGGTMVITDSLILLLVQPPRARTS